MLINQRHSIIPHHATRRSSVSQHVYKRISPPEIVRLSPGDKIIVVLPAITSTLAKNALPVIDHYRRSFSRVVDRTLRAISPADRTPDVDEAIRDRHIFLRSNAYFWEFESRVKSYPIREQLELESLDEAVIRTNWDQGAGIDVSVCGYTTQQSVLLKLRDVAYLQFYRRSDPESFLNDGIAFNDKLRNGSKLDGPFLHQLSLFDGCVHTILEILWKYYRALYLINQKNASSSCGAASLAASAAAVTPLQNLRPGVPHALNPAGFEPRIPPVSNSGPVCRV